MTRVACLRLPNWPVQRLRLDRPELRGGPLLVLRRDPRRGVRVVACCGRAARAGVRPGMTAADAEALLPSASARPADPAADLVALGRLAGECERFSPRVGWETLARPARPGPADPPDHLFLDLTGVAHLFGGEGPLGRQVVESCRGWGVAGRVAVADTPGAAWAVAADGGRVAVVPPGGHAAALAPLPVACLRVPADDLDTLGRLGVRTVGQLTRLSRAGLAERFGPALLACLDRAHGRAPEALVPHRPPPAFEAAQDFEVPTDRRDVLDYAFGQLTDRVAAGLHAAGRGAVRLAVELRCGPQTVCRDVGLYRPSDLAKPLLELLRLHCERLELPGPVEGVRLRADQTVRLRPRQDLLFPDPAGADDALAALVERLAVRLGADAVVRPVWQADALPERAVAFVPLAARPAASRARPRVPEVGHRPLRLFTPPRRIAVDAGAFVWQGGAPGWFAGTGRSGSRRGGGGAAGRGATTTAPRPTTAGASGCSAT